MGVALKDILDYEEVQIASLSNKTLAIDSFNMLFQFLASIRQSDGSPLLDSKGNVTSHLKGLFNRCVYFKKNNIKAIFVFDGQAPKLKEKERELRAQRRIEADKKYREALDLGMVDEAKKHAQALNKLDEGMVEDSKALIKAFGFAVVDAPSEGEAQACEFVKKGSAYATCSQDFDSLLFGTKLLLRNVSVSSRRKVAGSSVYKEVPIELYTLDTVLEKLGISQDELIIVAILCGTDFNVGGIKGIGPKKALKIVREYRDRWDEMFKILGWHDYFPYTWVEVFNTFKKMKVDPDAKVNFSPIDKDKIKELLTAKDFEETMLERSLKNIKNVKTLDSFF